MSLIPLTQSTMHLRFDDETGAVLMCTGNQLGDYTVVGPYVQDARIRDGHGRMVDITIDNALKVTQRSGLPFFFTDAAIADDNYFNLGTAPRDCTFAALYVETNDAIVSFDGGDTEHAYVDVGAGFVVLPGLAIPAGSVISGKNAAAGQNYTNLRVMVW